MRVDRVAPVGWGPGEKQVVGTAIGETSRVWFTVARGCLTEVFFPNPDRACLRRLSFRVAGDEVWDETREGTHTCAWDPAGTPLAQTTTADPRRRYALAKETIADPRSNVVLQRVRWLGDTAVTLHCVLEPAINNSVVGNEGFVLEFRGARLLGAAGTSTALALACDRGWRSCWPTPVATDRGAAIVGELAVQPGDELVFALGFADTREGAAHLAAGALLRGYAAIRAVFIAEWQDWLSRLRTSDARLWTRSVAVLKTCEAKHVDGGRVAALATPWGPARGPGPDGTYHAVWTRDLVESIGGMIAAGAYDEGVQTLTFLRSTQYETGGWPQNMLLDGSPLWHHEELDEAALPVLLVDLLVREQLFDDGTLDRAWPMIVRACEHVARTGPSTTYDRWEDTSGITPFTLATEIAALACGAALGRKLGWRRDAEHFEAVARDWYTRVDQLLYRRGGALADRLGIAGYYVRARDPGAPLDRPLDLARLPRDELSPDALALVRFGLRRADDPRIVDTLRAIDAVLSIELPQGPAWYRYPGDAYGEHADGAAFDGGGIGRPWPLLVGERAHYEIARGDLARAERLRGAMERFASETGMIPEQVWDAPDLPSHGLFLGRPTGSAAPLGWAHAEYVKLCRSLEDRAVFDMPTVQICREPRFNP
ncbi:MAG TPA: glycoside hydrolase family 15 protein [Kofleriaceae bacterium]|nr:glycoside hydrolase family 15 protein [Kofleriaceae bacterium]